MREIALTSSILLTLFVYDVFSYHKCCAFTPSIGPSDRIASKRKGCLSANRPPHDNLPSVYPEGTPAGLRGEAVRSALRSNQCIGWKFQDELQRSLVSVVGKGCIDFLNSKLSNTMNIQALLAEGGNTSVSQRGTVNEACLLNAKGRLVDKLTVALTSPERAFILTQPGHSSLFQRLDPYIFPLDQVTLSDETSDTFIFTLASTKFDNVRNVFDTFVAPQLGITEKLGEMSSRSSRYCQTFSISNDGDCTLLLLPLTDLPPCAAVGLHFCFMRGGKDLGESLWRSLISEHNSKGPVEIGPLEYETLRIEAGHPAYGKEYCAPSSNRQETDGVQETKVPASPLELHLEDCIDANKGCYLGQEGVASMLKNPRGPPRLLYQVVFPDESNEYDENDSSNLTRVPCAGDTLCVLGSNNEISVGTLTSVAEPAGTGDAVVLALALIRRADSILKHMQDYDLQITRPQQILEGGMIQPPPMDPLHGLEVIVEGSHTIGTLHSIPKRRFRVGQNMFEDNVPEFDEDFEAAGEAEVEVKVAENEPQKVQDQEASEAEAIRKAEKIEMLRKRAEEAMARRKQKKGN